MILFRFMLKGRNDVIKEVSFFVLFVAFEFDINDRFMLNDEVVLVRSGNFDRHVTAPIR